MRRSIRTTLLAASVAATLTLAACGGGTSEGGDSTADGQTVTFTTATMVQPNVPSAPVQDWFYDQLEERSDGRITVERTEPETICKAAEIAECVRDGRADIGVSISDYTPQLFPTMSLVTVPFMADNSQALMEALYKANTENAAAAAMWDSIGIELIAAWGPGKLIIGSNEPIDSIADISGVRFRVTGAFLQQAFEQVGANVVALTASETYEGIERGIADAVAWTLDGPVDYKLMEQLSTWADPGVGHYTTFAIWMNQDVYDSLPDDLKAIVDEVRDDLNGGAGMEAFNATTEVQCDTLLDFANTESLTAWDESATAEWKDAVQAAMLDEWVAQATEAGLADAEGYLADYQAALEEASSQPDIVQDPVAACVAEAASR